MNNENNKLIADFMCDKPSFDTYYFKTFHFHIDESEYHSSWDWLMPVVEKISKMSKPQREDDEYVSEYYFRTFGAIETETGKFMVRINGFFLQSSDSLIEATYEAVVEFIKWYNSNNPPQLS